MGRMLFVGERRSDRAKQIGVRWEDGRLAAKQLFGALRENGVGPENCVFINWFERSTKSFIKAHNGPVFGMGRNVQKALTKAGVDHIPIVHPAARGKIRKKERYCTHIKEALELATAQ